jgi:lysozyme
MSRELVALGAGVGLLAALLTNDTARTLATDTLDQAMDIVSTDITPALLENSNLRAFLRTIRAGEGTADTNGYRRIFGGQLFDSYADHPRVYVTYGNTTTSAAGAYQFLAGTWDDVRRAINLPDFSPRSQDLGAAWLIRRRGALRDVLAGRFDDAIRKCAKEWASLPGAPYGQPTKTLAQARATYLQAGGTFA